MISCIGRCVICLTHSAASKRALTAKCSDEPQSRSVAIFEEGNDPLQVASQESPTLSSAEGLDGPAPQRDYGCTSLRQEGVSHTWMAQAVEAEAIFGKVKRVH